MALLAVAVSVAAGACGDDPRPGPVAKVAKVAEVARVGKVGQVAKGYAEGLKHGQTLGHLAFPRFHKTVSVTTGFDQRTIDRGPGWYSGSRLPGEGGTIYIAGHRLTHGGPFREIGDLRRGDEVVFTTPYAVATYEVRHHRRLSEQRTSILTSGNREELRLQASTIPPGHQRLLVFARLERIERRSRD